MRLMPLHRPDLARHTGQETTQQIKAAKKPAGQGTKQMVGYRETLSINIFDNHVRLMVELGFARCNCRLFLIYGPKHVVLVLQLKRLR